jgi:class 3 adenylate cyclase/tetratricopeptide (TPR) repeat protein
VKRFIGEGAKKRVYLVRDERLDRDVAFALIKTEGLDEAGRTRVRREAQAMGRLGDHPHVVTVHDISEDEGQLYIVSQYMSGGDLEAHLQAAENRRLTIDETLRIAEELCRALEHAHARSVIHRDLKPGNIWLAEDGTAKLGDFGLGLSLDRSRLTQEGMMVGTAAYMSPEQALSGEVTRRSDLYALGVVIYEMVTGRPPFLGDDVVAVVSQHINTAPVAPSWHNPELPRALEALILRLLAKDPSARPESAEAVCDELARVSSVRADVVAPVEREAANPLDRLAGGVFVGRDHELTQLRTALDDSLSGRGHVLMLVGEPGIGKTRTAEELTTYARLRGAQVLWGRSYEGEGAPSYWPWVQIIRSYIHGKAPETLLAELGAGASAVADVVSEVRERIPEIQPAPPLEPDQARFRLFDGVTGFLKNASQRQPLVLVLDDLHWADKPSLLLLQFLVSEFGESRILVLGTYRDVEVRRTHPLTETLAELNRVGNASRILLRGLAEADVGRFIELSAGREPPPPVLSAVYRETEGNPFFLHEVVRLLTSEGRLEHSEDVRSWSLSIPRGVREVIGRRLNSLSDECNRVVTIASAIGREFEFAVLERVADVERDPLMKVMEEAIAARVIEEMLEAIDRYRFAHSLVRETLYDELGTARRIGLHRQIGEVLEAHYGSRVDRHLAELAYHAVEGAHGGGDLDKAIDYATRAGDRASGLFAYEDAIPHYERALQVLELKESDDDLQRCDLLISLGYAQQYSQDRDRSVGTLTEALGIAREHEDPLRFVSAATGVAWASWSAGQANQTSVTLLEEGLEMLRDQDCIERVTALHALAFQLCIGHTNPRAKELAQEAIDVARRMGDAQALGLALYCHLEAHLGLDGIDERLAMATEMLHHANTTGIPMHWWAASFYLRRCALQIGDRVEFERLYRKEEQLLGRTQTTVSTYFHHVATATRAILDADWDGAERLARLALESGQRVHGDFALLNFGAQMVSVLLARGKTSGAVSLLETGAREHASPAWEAALAWLYAECGNENKAQAILDALCADDCAALPRDVGWAMAMASLCQTCALLGDQRQAEKLYALLAPYPRQIVITASIASLQGCTSYHLGRLAGVLGRWDEGAAHFEDALEVTAAIGSRFWLADTEWAYAQLLRERDRLGDRERAIELTNRALDAGRRYQMDYIVNKALPLKLELQGLYSDEIQGSIHGVASSVEEMRPDLAPHTAPDGTVTIMFSDMEGFTAMTERLGDLKAREVVRAHNAIVRKQLAAHSGYEVELQGDGFLLAFSSARRALRCAIGVQKAFAVYNETDPKELIRVRIGLHTGEVLKDADKFFGKTVILAARIAAQAEGGQILVSSLLKELTQSVGDLRFGKAREVELKGISERQRLFTVEWE